MATRVSFDDILGLPDILSNDAFYFVIASVPAGGSGDVLRNLALKCLNTNIAGSSTEKMTVALHSHQRNFRGRGIQPQTLSVTYYEDQTMATYKILKAWKEFIVGTRSGVSRGFLHDYSTSATLTVFDHPGNPIMQTTFYNLFITDIPDMALDGGSSAPLQISVTFSYDYTDADIVPNT